MHCTTLPYAIHLGWRPNNGFNRKYRVNILHNISLEIVLCRCACLRVCVSVWKRIQWQYCVEWMNRIVSENYSHTVGYNRTYIFKITIRIVVDGGERVYHFSLDDRFIMIVMNCGYCRCCCYIIIFATNKWNNRIESNLWMEMIVEYRFRLPIGIVVIENSSWRSNDIYTS